MVPHVECRSELRGQLAFIIAVVPLVADREGVDLSLRVLAREGG